MSDASLRTRRTSAAHGARALRHSQAWHARPAALPATPARRRRRRGPPVALADELGRLASVARLELAGRHDDGVDAELLVGELDLEGLAVALATPDAENERDLDLGQVHVVLGDVDGHLVQEARRDVVVALEVTEVALGRLDVLGRREDGVVGAAHALAALEERVNHVAAAGDVLLVVRGVPAGVHALPAAGGVAVVLLLLGRRGRGGLLELGVPEGARGLGRGGRGRGRLGVPEGAAATRGRAGREGVPEVAARRRAGGRAGGRGRGVPEGAGGSSFWDTK